MTEKRFVRISVCGDWGVKDTENDKVLFFGTTDEVKDTIDVLNALYEENQQKNERIEQLEHQLYTLSGLWASDKEDMSCPFRLEFKELSE